MIFALYLLSNIFDYLILIYFFNHTTEKRFTNQTKLYFRSILFAISITLINIFEIPILNLMISTLLIFVFSFQYRIPIFSRIIFVICYIAIGLISEPLGMLLLLQFSGQNFSKNTLHYVIIFFCELFRFCTSYFLVTWGKYKNIKLPAKISFVLLSVPILGIISSCLVFHITNSKNRFLCFILLVFIFLSNVAIYYAFIQMNNFIDKQRETQLILQEIKLREDYYKEIEDNNKIIYKIRHDLKNQLYALYDIIDHSNTTVVEQLESIIGKISLTENKIYTSNSILNSILKIKFSQAQKSGIKLEHTILIPPNLNMPCGEIGILYGNILDNAIEACNKITKAEKWIIFNTKYQNESLFISLCNSIEKNTIPNIYISSKASVSHGLGISSVKAIVKKYHGGFDYVYLEGSFEIRIILYINKLDTQ